MNQIKKYIIGRPDSRLILFVCGFASIGLIMLLSASSYESEKSARDPLALFVQQSIAVGLGGIVMFLTSLFDYRYLRKFGWILSILCICFLCLVDFSSLGISSGGSERWLNLGPLTFQPSEIAKIAALILMADGLANFKWNSGPILLRLIICLVMAVLILKEPDLGTAVIIISTIGYLLFASGLNLFLAIGALVTGFGGVVLSLQFNPYQMERFQGWLSPEKDPLGAGYNLLQSYYAIGNGGLFGVGYGNSIQKLGYLPVSYADYIFPVISEELGVVGSLLIVGGFVYFLWRGNAAALKIPGGFGRLLGLGIVFSLALQAIFNLSGVIGLLPMTGVPLPFISYGKTSIIMTGFMVGILINLSKHKVVSQNKV